LLSRIWRSDRFKDTTPQLEVSDLVNAMQHLPMFCEKSLTVSKAKICGKVTINEEIDVKVGYGGKRGMTVDHGYGEERILIRGILR
jgi:hypothetical protein